jgi:putative membrane protein
VKNADEARPADELDVDARFLLANERTLLAWVRTSLTFLVAGVGVQQFAVDLRAREVVTLLLLGAAVLCAGAGTLRYLRADTDLRAGRLPATGRVPVVVGGSLVVVSAAAILAVLIGAVA